MGKTANLSVMGSATGASIAGCAVGAQAAISSIVSMMKNKMRTCFILEFSPENLFYSR
jgi:hypothetical protein